jgi:hypothetical protein
LICVLVALAAAIVVLALHSGSPFFAGAFAVVLLLALAAVFSTLTISITATEIAWWLSFRLFTQRIALADVDLVATKRLGVLSLFGVRTNGRDTSWIVSGRDAIELVRADGRRTIVGTADPSGVFAALSRLIDERTWRD